jgi:hypothetical protein
MKQIEQSYIKPTIDVFNSNFQDKLDWLNSHAEKFKIEEYFNNIFTIFILQDKIYTFRVIEQNNQLLNGTINQLDDIKELYPFLRRKRGISEISELKKVSLEIENKYKELNKK